MATHGTGEKIAEIRMWFSAISGEKEGHGVSMFGKMDEVRAHLQSAMHWARPPLFVA